MSRQKRQMNLTAFCFPPGAWRLPQASADIDMSFTEYVHLAKTAERGKFDTLFFQDTAASYGSDAMSHGDRTGTYSRIVRLEPMTLLAGLATVTKNIGLIATGTTTYNDPYHLARRFLTIDHMSGGRAGWNLVTSQIEDEAANFGRDHHVDHAERYDRASEFYDVVADLWDSWEDGAILRDKASGLFFDAGKVHLLNHKGKHFSVRGPLNVARSPQGRPVVAQAGSSEPGRELAAKTADIVFTAQSTLSDAQDFYRDVKGRMGRYGRSPEHMRIMPGINIVVGRTESEARARREEMDALVTDEVALRSIARLTGGLDLSKYPIDGPLPELPPSNAAKARQKILIDMARTENLSIRQLAHRFAQATGHHVLVGTPAYMADVMEHWFMEGGADGYTVLQPHYPQPLEDFVELVIPELQRRGIFRTEYSGTTLRENLGVPFPENRFTKSARA
jgi:FMN-dependent oxidoreductase (nitrilotriacetate monooxygenase family)